MRRLLNEVVDGHVMVETVALEADYTGDRNYKCLDEIIALENATKTDETKTTKTYTVEMGGIIDAHGIVTVEASSEEEARRLARYSDDILWASTADEYPEEGRTAIPSPST